MASEKSTIAEYAYINIGEREYPKFFPCNISVASISICSTNNGGRAFTSAPDLVEAIKALGRSRRVPLVMLCLTEKETKQSKLAKELLEQPCAFKYTGPNTYYPDKHIFTDIIFETGAK